MVFHRVAQRGCTWCSPRAFLARVCRWWELWYQHHSGVLFCSLDFTALLLHFVPLGVRCPLCMSWRRLNKIWLLYFTQSQLYHLWSFCIFGNSRLDRVEHLRSKPKLPDSSKFATRGSAKSGASPFHLASRGCCVDVTENILSNATTSPCPGTFFGEACDKERVQARNISCSASNSAVCKGLVIAAVPDDRSFCSKWGHDCTPWTEVRDGLSHHIWCWAGRYHSRWPCPTAASFYCSTGQSDVRECKQSQ